MIGEFREINKMDLIRLPLGVLAIVMWSVSVFAQTSNTPKTQSESYSEKLQHIGDERANKNLGTISGKDKEESRKGNLFDAYSYSYKHGVGENDPMPDKDMGAIDNHNNMNHNNMTPKQMHEAALRGEYGDTAKKAAEAWAKSGGTFDDSQNGQYGAPAWTQNSDGSWTMTNGDGKVLATSPGGMTPGATGDATSENGVRVTGGLGSGIIPASDRRGMANNMPSDPIAPGHNYAPGSGGKTGSNTWGPQTGGMAPANGTYVPMGGANTNAPTWTKNSDGSWTMTNNGGTPTGNNAPTYGGGDWRNASGSSSGMGNMGSTMGNAGWHMGTESSNSGAMGARGPASTGNWSSNMGGTMGSGAQTYGGGNWGMGSGSTNGNMGTMMAPMGNMMAPTGNMAPVMGNAPMGTMAPTMGDMSGAPMGAGAPAQTYGGGDWHYAPAPEQQAPTPNP